LDSANFAGCNDTKFQFGSRSSTEQQVVKVSDKIFSKTTSGGPRAAGWIVGQNPTSESGSDLSVSL
jgi:hypothetical protein